MLNYKKYYFLLLLGILILVTFHFSLSLFFFKISFTEYLSFLHNKNVIDNEKDAIGRRYRRQDAIGTPFCVTIDHQTIDDDTVTIRDRDSMKQDRIHVKEIHSFLDSSLDINNWLLISD